MAQAIYNLKPLSTAFQLEFGLPMRSDISLPDLTSQVMLMLIRVDRAATQTLNGSFSGTLIQNR
jgi:hypothetical protein